MNSSIQIEIQNLVLTKREGQYWDFKEKHHDNSASLLHDILCLSNSLYKGNKYLIFGVSDPKSGCEIKGIEEQNKKSQSDFIDLIRSKQFAGDIRPEVELRTIELEGKKIDVLIVFDKPLKPYYLREKYRHQDKEVRANSIYTRNIDTNTPINMSADIGIIEMMWRERFGLDIQPSSRFIDLLNKPEEWNRDIDNKAFAYHEYYPEYQIEFGVRNNFKEVFSYFYANKKSFRGEAKFKYLSTTLFTLPYMYCDEMRILLAVPTNAHVQLLVREVWYMYYVLESRNGAFLNFITDGRFNFGLGESIFLVFRNSDEQKDFNHYLEKNLDRLDSMDDSSVGINAQNKIKDAGDDFLFNPIEIVNIKKIFDIWKEDKDIT